MITELIVQKGIIIPLHEIEISASKSGGPGGQHVNTSNTRITLRWNIHTTQALTPEQKELVLTKLAPEITSDGSILLHSSSHRSQHQNKQAALAQLANKIRTALHIPKKRRKTTVPRSVKTSRLERKRRHGLRKKMRKAED